MDFSFILRQLQSILITSRVTLIPLVFILVNILIFIISRTFRKTGLLVLAIAFGLDYTIKSIPFDIYYNYPQVYNFITVLYILGFLIFFFKVLKILIRMGNQRTKYTGKTDSNLNHFLKYTGILPFLAMLFLNVIHIENIIGEEILRILTSLSFIYMLVKTIYSTYNYVSTKESIVLGDKMDFREIKEYLKSGDKKDSYRNSKNQGRRIRKTEKKESFQPSQTIKIEKEAIDEKISMANIEQEMDKESEEVSIENKANPLSNTDLLNLISGDFVKKSNKTTMSIQNLKTSEKISFTSTRPILKIQENNEYKIDLEFENINEYDYGRFIDILLKYSKDKNAYKFELIVSPNGDPTSRVIFFDPSNIYDIDEKDYANVGGKVISMNFPKYKINFIKGN
ncbi:hypothetical protein [Anaerococcus sp. Marseille-Q5996]|uniref:hypothetical protein n=1 Tax=Anaerococcus sp. Marseille-Q5996 TaxID=2972769 RepID=UPI0021C961A2|nr:hypothetical protein [Anaerococcus sp. Marseille-Q5996]